MPKKKLNGVTGSGRTVGGSSTRGARGLGAWPRALRMVFPVLLMLVGVLAVSQSWAAAGTYRLYIDSDVNAATGCAASLIDRFGGGSESGFEYQLTVAVDTAGNASGPTLATCSGDSFAGAEPVGRTAPRVAIVPHGASLLAQLELSLPAAAIGATPGARVVLASEGDYIHRLSPTSAAPIALGSAGGPGGPGAGSVQPIPTQSAGVLGALAALLLALGALALRHARRSGATHVLLAVVLIALGGSGMAAITLIIDGDTHDWAGLPVLATDMTGDQVHGSADLHSLTASFQGEQLFLRIDTVEGANPQQEPSPLEIGSPLPRFTTHPSLAATVGQPWRYAPQATDQASQTLGVTLSQAPV